MTRGVRHYRIAPGVTAITLVLCFAPPAAAQSVQELQRQIDELKTMVRQLQQEAQQRTPATALATPPATTPAPPQVAEIPPPRPMMTGPAQVAVAPPQRKAWYDRLRLRGYTQMRLNETISGGDLDIPSGSRLRSVHDGGVTETGNFTFRRLRIVLEGRVSDDVSIYIQPDFATRVGGQSVGEPREGFGQIRDAYADWFPDKEHRLRLRFGQSKVPFGWENLQSSSNRLTLDRSDGINSAVPSERELGIVAYYTPTSVQRIWDRLADAGQKLFGNYGAFGVGVFNGQGINRVEVNNDLMTVAMATWPVELANGQVVEFGGALLRNRVQPEIRTGGTSPTAFRDERVGLHAMLYPQPFGIQAEWNWGRGPEFDTRLGAITTRPLDGGYIQTMWRVGHSPLGTFMPYARWQRYRGGWKAAINAPRLATNELELGIEFQPIAPLELTLAYSRMHRQEADERRIGRAEGSLIRTQLQFNY